MKEKYEIQIDEIQIKMKARRGRFELPGCKAPPVFKTGAVGRLAISAYDISNR